MADISRIKNVDLMNLHYAWHKFADAMWEKLVEKHEAGFRGWDTDSLEHIRELAYDHMMQQHVNDGGEEVDVANFMMFIWYRAIAAKEG